MLLTKEKSDFPKALTAAATNGLSLKEAQWITF